MYQLISTPSGDATLYIQQNEENEKQRCALAIRKITVATIMGQRSNVTLTLHHHQLGRKRLCSSECVQSCLGIGVCVLI